MSLFRRQSGPDYGFAEVGTLGNEFSGPVQDLVSQQPLRFGAQKISVVMAPSGEIIKSQQTFPDQQAVADSLRPLSQLAVNHYVQSHGRQPNSVGILVMRTPEYAIGVTSTSGGEIHPDDSQLQRFHSPELYTWSNVVSTEIVGNDDRILPPVAPGTVLRIGRKRRHRSPHVSQPLDRTFAQIIAQDGTNFVE